MFQRFDKCMVHQIPMEENGRADALFKFGAMVSRIKEMKVAVMIREVPKIEEMVISTVESDELFKRTLEGMLLKCLDNELAEYMLKEIHGGSCGNHPGGRSLSQQITRQGYFWPTMVTDAMEFSKTCEISREEYRSVVQRAEDPATLHGSWKSSSKWPDRGNKSDLVAIFEDKTGRSKRVVGRRATRRFMGIPHDPRNATGETPFCLVYGSEAIIPVEIGEETAKVSQYESEHNAEERSLDLSTIEEKRDRPYARILRYKKLMMRGYNQKVKPRSFQVGDLVLKKVEVSRHVGKLDPTWEGPYKVT
ncbi:UNVERIFIED_CONTAM: hypothetical protein Slati_2690000 [Sesamum latifolium]|uniref:Integrase zinc-binding domain-containing protein n=1 Tax=Sesamum latifolium TaxID=2727402 RepID=A0AAW2VVF8_9LAMI